MDVIFVTYNSEKWIEACFSSLSKSLVDLKKLNIWVVDNYSIDRTKELLFVCKQKYAARFGGFNIIFSEENLGFGKANNLGAFKGMDDIICFLNIDTEVFPDTFDVLNDEISESAPNVAIWELRQLPYEHPKLYNPITLETSWSSGAAFAIKRSVFEKIGGFDPYIFMYAEDVDLSWRVRNAGYSIRYTPKAALFHYSYQVPGEVKPVQRVNSIINNLWLRHKFGKIKEIIVGHILFWGYFCLKNSFPGQRAMLWNNYKNLHKNIKYITKENIHNSSFFPLFIRFDYEIARDGAYYESVRLHDDIPLVSILVRTCGRPHVLRETLKSIQNQTYENFEVIVVEDGKNISEEMILKEFSSLNIRYFSTGVKVGRSKAGNLAMSKAKGKYLNFLDDDDLFFADHIEVLVGSILNSDKKVAYATAFETPIEILNENPYQYKIKGYVKRYIQDYDDRQLCHHNYIPIQCVLFEKELFEKYGGLDENLDALEDWDLWVRYSLYTDFAFVYKTTSIYRVPHNKMKKLSRQKNLDDALIKVREKHKSYMRTKTMSVYDIAMEYENNGK